MERGRASPEVTQQVSCHRLGGDPKQAWGEGSLCEQRPQKQSWDQSGTGESPEADPGWKGRRFSTGRAVQGQKELSGQSVSCLSLEVFKQKLGTPPHTPPRGCLGDSCIGMPVGRLLGRNKDAAPAPRAMARSFIHSAHVHRGLLLPGWGPGAASEKNLRSQLSATPSRGEAGAGQGTEDGGAGCPRSMSQICIGPPLKERARGHGLGRGRHNATSSCTHPFQRSLRLWAHFLMRSLEGLFLIKLGQ